MTGDKHALAARLGVRCPRSPEPGQRAHGAKFMSFSHDDVQRLIKLLDSSHFDELHLEAEGIKLTLRRNGAASTTPSTAPAPAVSTSPGFSSPIAPPIAPPARAAAVAPVAAALPTSDPTLLEIRAPMLGTFYGAPKPGADPFVAIGHPNHRGQCRGDHRSHETDELDLRRGRRRSGRSPRARRVTWSNSNKC